jgi:chromosome segregation ATPase
LRIFDKPRLSLRHFKQAKVGLHEESMMEKGSFHTSVNPVIQQNDEAVRKIALPNQLPKGIDFSELPIERLKSSTLESLINQNEDLMARLSVSLRRANEFEDRIQSLESENSTLRARFETIKDQYLLVSEKDKISTSRTLQLHEEGVTYKKKSEKLEKAYSDLFVQAQAFQHKLIQAERNSARYRKAAYALKRPARISKELRAELDQAIASHKNSVHGFEAKLAQAKMEIDGMRAKISERDRLFQQKVQLENDLVQEQRQFLSFREESHNHIDRLETENASLRSQVKETLVLNESQAQDIIKLNQEIPHLRDEKQNLIEQVESLQALWNHKQKELEALEEKNKSLQKLNQSISLTLNQQRKTIHQLEQELEKERFQSSEKIKVLSDEIQLLRERKD